MAIYHCSKSEVQRSKGHNAIAASSYISRSKLQLITTGNKGEKGTISYNFTSRKGLAHSIILAPDDAPSWVYNRQELWNRAESAETRKNAETARKLIIALPKELTLQQNIELIEQFALECLVSHGMVADINIHCDNENNPHGHIQMTTRKLIRSLENDQVIFGEKGRDWGRKKFLYYYRENVAHFINLYLEKHGHLDRVSHLSHKARGIDLIPTIHEGSAHYIKDSKLRLINEQILKENAAKIRTNSELVFDKLSINKPVFTREEIAIALSDALTIDIESGQADKQEFQQRLREISKQLVAENLVTENVKEYPAQDLTILADGSSKQDSEVSNSSTVEDSNNTGSIAIDHSSHNSAGLSNIELLNQAYSTEFMRLYSNLLVSDKISLINPSDLKGRTLYALTKRVKLEQRFIGTVEELQHSQNHNLSIDDRAIGSMKDKLIANIQKVGMAVQKVINDKIGLKIELTKEQSHSLTEEQSHSLTEEQSHSLTEEQSHSLTEEQSHSLTEEQSHSLTEEQSHSLTEEQSHSSTEEQSHSLTKEQRKAIIEIVCGKDISVLEGYPGAGKTFVMREIVRQYRKAGYRIIGTAQSSSATKVLEGATGVESKNITLWRKEWQEARGHEFELPLRTDYYTEREYQYPDRVESNFSQQKNVSTELDNKTVFIIDEASMIELANMDYLLTQVLKSGAKVIIVGDNNQLSAIGMAGAFKKICTIADVSKLTAVMRHKHPNEYTRELQRKATKLMGLYKIEEALAIYQALEVFNIYENEKVTKEALVTNYVSEYLVQANNLARDDLVSIRSIVIGAYTNVSVNYFNIEVRERLKQAGVLKGLGGNFKSGHEMVELLRGEQIVFVSNKAEYKKFYGVLNGELATVIDFTAPDKFGHGCVHLLVHKADGSKKIVKIDTADSLYPVRFKHGYAVTGYKLQGETVDYMNVYYEPTIGYEAFNVLMSRYRYEVKLYAAQDVLEDIVYKRVEEDPTKGRTRFSIEGYRLQSEGRGKQPVPGWYIGLTIGVSKRINNNLAINYRKFDKLSPNEQVIKNYLESRQLVFDLHGKMQEWQEQQERPIKLAGLYARLTTTANVEMKNAREITIDPYGLLLSQAAKKEIDQSKMPSSKEFKKVELQKSPISQNSEKILWFKILREKQNELIWKHLSEYDRQILVAIYEELAESKEELQKWAKIICNNYHGSVKDKAIENSEVKDQVTMGDRIIQLDLNYQTIQKHAGYSFDKYFFEKINQRATLIASNHWRKMMEICYGLRTQNITVPNILNSQDIVDTSNNNTDWLNIFTTNLDDLNEFINETKLSLIEKTELLQKTNFEHQEIKKELEEITNYREQLFPEFLSRIYKTPASKVLQRWQNLLVECQYEQLADAISKVKQNPKLLGSFRGIGFGNTLGISRRRKDAISNFEVIAKRFRNYEQGAIKAQELQDKLTAGNYQKLLERLSKETTLLTDRLPNKYEQSFLDQLDILQKDGKLNIENLAAIVKTDELRGLIYEYYRYINNTKLAKSIKPSDIQGENQQEINSSLSIKIDETQTKESKIKIETNEDRTNKYNRVSATRNNRLDFNEVRQSLTEYNYRNIFESYARRINGDNVRFKRTSSEISLGSLTMNSRTGLWIRHSTGEGGNIFSFVQKALCCSKLEALERVALTAGISARENNYYYNDNARSNHNNKQFQESKGHEEVITKSINEWYAQPYVPDYAPKFDPKVHLASMLKSNIVDGIYYYKNNQKQLIGLTVRLNSRQDGKKQVLPVSYCSNEALNQEAWRLKGFSDNGHKPIYHIDKIKDDQRIILIVEGEKTCDKAQELLPDYIVLSWLGGSNGAGKANWQQLAGREVVIWADNDQAGITAARTIGQMINEANGRIGNVTIIEPSRLEFNGTINENILPEKWDLADKLPTGLNIDNLKEAIRNGQQQNISLHNSQSIAARLQQLLPQSQELAIGERILWQARSVGSLLTIEQIIQEATTEFNWQEKLTSPEAKYYMKYAETTGKDGSKHEFLGLQDGIYRDTLVAIAQNSKIKDKESLKLPELIQELQSDTN